MSNGFSILPSWCSCGSQQLGESVWSPVLAKCQPLIFSLEMFLKTWRFLAPSFSLMLQCSSACYMHGPISTCYWGLLFTATSDNRIRCSYLMRFSVNHIWVPWHSLISLLLLSSLGYSLDAHSLSLARAFRMFGIQIVMKYK
jgi:hypothetical protein